MMDTLLLMRLWSVVAHGLLGAKNPPELWEL